VISGLLSFWNKIGRRRREKKKCNTKGPGLLILSQFEISNRVGSAGIPTKNIAL